MSQSGRVLVSWDVGVVHLGLCVVRRPTEEEDTPHPHQILHWDNLNLLQDDEAYQTCGESSRQGPCRLRAIWVLRAPGGPYYCCGRHQRACQSRCDGDLESYYRPVQHAHTCQGVRRDGASCPSAARWKGPSGYLCTMHRRRHEKVLARDCQLQKIVRRRAMKIPITELQQLLLRRLDELIPVMVEHGVTHCYIENQPGKTAGSMKSIGTTLANWAILRGQIDHTQGWHLQQVRFVNACNKIKLTSTDGQLRVHKASGKDKYRLTKALAVEYARQLVAETPWSEVLEAFTKKDDPCDALLQGLYMLEEDE